MAPAPPNPVRPPPIALLLEDGGPPKLGPLPPKADAAADGPPKEGCAFTGEAFVAPAPPKPTELPPKPNAFLWGSAAAEPEPEAPEPQSTFATNIELVAAAPLPLFAGLLVGLSAAPRAAAACPP